MAASASLLSTAREMPPPPPPKRKEEEGKGVVDSTMATGRIRAWRRWRR